MASKDELMNQPLATPGQVIDAWSTWADGEMKSVILRTQRMEVMRLHVNAGKRVPTYEAHGEITILCVQGRVIVEMGADARELNSGQMLYLLVNEPFSLQSLEEASLLITILRPQTASPLIGEDPESRRQAACNARLGTCPSIAEVHAADLVAPSLDDGGIC